MPSLIGPILAQAITLGVGASAEARAVVEEDVEYQGTASPSADLRVAWRRLELTLRYGFSIDAAPLDHEPRDVSLFHFGAIGVTRSFGHTTVGLGHSFTLGTVNFQTRALSLNPGDPGSGDAGPGGPTRGPRGAVTSGGGTSPPSSGGSTSGAGASEARMSDRVVRHGTSSTDLSVTHEATPTTTWRGAVGYAVTGGLDRESAADYPLVESNRVSVGVVRRLSPRDGVSGSVTGEYASALYGATVMLASAEAGYWYAFSRATTGSVAARVSGSRAPESDDSFVTYTFYPGFTAGIVTSSTLGRGRISFDANASAAPALDLVVVAVDPRIGLGAGVSYTLRRFAASASVSTSLSTAGGAEAGAMRSVSGSAGASYGLTDFLSVNGGVRGAFQTFEGETVLPFTYAAFLGLAFATAVPITR